VTGRAVNGIFISYRRADSAPYAGRICDHLRRTFPSVSVFMDVGAIAAGADFTKAIDANLAGSAVVLAVIGPQWESIRGSNAQHGGDDYVVRELAAAIERGANIIPLLVGGATMGLGALWETVIEIVRVGNTHLSYRGGRVQWGNGNGWMLFLLGVVLSWLTSLLHFWMGRTRQRGPDESGYAA